MSNSWIPLESNPDVMNSYLEKLGVSGPYTFHDIWSLDEEALGFMPSDVVAVILLFPITAKYEEFRKKQEESIRSSGEHEKIPSDVYFIKQTIGNACGTIGLLHAIGNNMNRLELADGFFKDFLEMSAAISATERAALLENPDSFGKHLAAVHQEFSLQGQTQAPSADEDVDLHFACFVENNGNIYELDGRKPFPISHGLTNGSLLQSAAKVIQSFIQRDSELLQFTVLALAAP